MMKTEFIKVYFLKILIGLIIIIKLLANMKKEEIFYWGHDLYIHGKILDILLKKNILLINSRRLKRINNRSKTDNLNKEIQRYLNQYF